VLAPNRETAKEQRQNSGKQRAKQREITGPTAGFTLLGTIATTRIKTFQRHPFHAVIT
jgi:hypothetical protein